MTEETLSKIEAEIGEDEPLCIDDTKHRCYELIAEVRKLRAALEPFAKAAGHMRATGVPMFGPTTNPDCFAVSCVTRKDGQAVILMEDMWRAQSVFSGETKP